MEPPLTVGTAGHIDHGKTALVRALTGRDTDRLDEERRRGISIELGFAPLELGGRRLSLIDVPGHERLVRTMIAGASGIDLFLLVVAADDGPMPQTREHLAVLRALGVGHGVVALSKIDLVDAARRERAAAACAELLPGVPLVAVSSRSGEGLEELRAALAATADEVTAARGGTAGEAGDGGAGGVRRVHAPVLGVGTDSDDASPGEAPVLHVDRSFTLAGYGTIVTGTLWSGALEQGQRVLILPSGREARVRSLQVHDAPRERAEPHQRVAVNLTGVRRGEVRRGDVLTVPGGPVRPTYRLDVALREGAGAIAAERRVQAHLGTRESPARVIDLGRGEAQLRLERPLLARRGDRVVVRRIAPPDTLGGGTVLDPAPPRHGPGRRAPATRLPFSPDSEAKGRRVGGLSAETPEPGPLARRLLALLEADGARPPSAGPLAGALGTEVREVEMGLRELVAAGEVVRVSRDVAYPVPVYRRLRGAVLDLSRQRGSTSIAEVRDALGLSRKYAQALLEHLDGERLLRREGDRHYPRQVVPQRA